MSLVLWGYSSLGARHPRPHIPGNQHTLFNKKIPTLFPSHFDPRSLPLKKLRDFFSGTGKRAMAASSEAPSIDFTPDSSKQLEMAIRAVQQGLRSVEIVYASHPRWPLPRRILPNPSTTASSNTISITGSGKLFFFNLAASIINERLSDENH